MSANWKIAQTTHMLRYNSFPRAIAALLLLCGVLGMVGAIARPAHADSTTYSTTRRQYKVGILLLDSTDLNDGRGPENPDPFVFYIADERKDVKPQGWEFVNPLAPGVVTAVERDRWLARDPNHPYQLGQKVAKNMAAYWEVSLTRASIQELLQFDLLFIHNHRPTAFSPADREKLRSLVDAGGTVWVENCGGMNISFDNPFFLEEVQFRSQTSAGQPVIYRPDHPLLNSPYQLSLQEVANLGDKNFQGAVSFNDGSNGGAPRMPNAEVLVNIVGNNAFRDAQNVSLPYIAAGTYGAGTVIISAGDSGCDINDSCGGVNAGSGGNSGAFAGTNLQAAHIEDLKFLYNLAAWGSVTTTERRNNRRTGAAFDAVGASVVTNFNFDNDFTRAVRPADIVESRTSALVVKNALYVSGLQGGNITVRCYDTQPFSDLDGDGNFDDGLPDIGIGLPYDEVWRFQGPAGTQPSAPVYGSVSLANGTHQDVIFISLADGTLVALNALPTSGAGGSALPTPSVFYTVPGGGGTYQTPTGTAVPPVFFENRIYQVMPNGLLRCINARDGLVMYTSFLTAPNYTMQPTAAPTVGYVRQVSQLGDTSPRQRRGGTFALNSNDSTNDLMLYAPCLVIDANGTVSGRIITYWLGTRNEVQRTWAAGARGNEGWINTRVAGGQGGPGAQWYRVATSQEGFTRASAGFLPFVQPRVRVFSARYQNDDPAQPIIATAAEQYQNGIPSTYYGAEDFDGSPNVLDQITPLGEVHLVKLPGASASIPDPRPGVDILVAVDYDVLYLPADVDFDPPANYAQNPTQIGARPSPVLNIPFMVGNLLNTAALNPQDLLIFSTDQQWQAGSSGGNPGPRFSSLLAINEQEGDVSGSTSRIRWRYSIFNDATAASPNPLYLERSVDNVVVADRVPLVNYLQFDANWPATDSATRANAPERLRNLTVVGSPITTNEGVTYSLAQAVSDYNGGRPVTVLMAFRSDPTITLTLPPFDDSLGVTVSQANLLSDPDNPQVLSAPASLNPGAPIVMDGERGVIAINNMRVGNNIFSASQSFVVRYTPRGGGEERRAIISPLPSTPSLPGDSTVDDTGQVTVQSQGFSPLLWYYVLPGTPGTNTSPTLSGDLIYWSGFVGTTPYIFAVDARPQDNDPTVRIGFGDQAIKVVANLINVASGGENKINHVRMAQQITRPNTLNAFLPPVVGSQGNLIVNSSLGPFAYKQGTTLIADSKRLVEAGSDGAAIWVMNSTIDRKVGGGEEPVFGPDPNNPNTIIILNPPATGVAQNTRDAFARPSTARRIAGSDYLISDTGNNRVVRADRGSETKWELSRFVDPNGLLGSGEPTTLNGPTDVAFYLAPTLDSSGQVTGYEAHYVVADAGNFRIIEVADYYDTNGRPAPRYGEQPGEHVLVFTTRTASQGKKYRFKSLQRFLGVGPAGTPQAGYYGYPYLTAIVSNTSVGTGSASTSADTTGGSVVRISYAPFDTTIALRNGSTLAPDKLWLPPGAGQTAREQEPIGNGTVLLSFSSVQIAEAGQPVREKQISAPVFFQQLNIPALSGNGTRTLFLLCDADGAYVVEARPNGATTDHVVLWMFSQNDYDRINGIDPASGTILAGGRLTFPGLAPTQTATAELRRAMPRWQPTSIQLLPSGNYLISNAFAGRSILFESGQFNGEVIEINPSGFSVLLDVAFGNTQRGGTFVGFAVPRLEAGATNAGTGVGLNRQVMGNPTSNTGLLEQPLFAYRP